MRRLIVLIPFAAAFAMIFGGYYAIAGLRTILSGNPTFGAFFLVYGLGGLLIGVALWRAYRDYRKRLRESNAAALSAPDPTKNAEGLPAAPNSRPPRL